MTRSIGLWGAFALGVGTMIGNGVFMLPTILAPYGSMSLIGWLFAGCGTLSIAVVFGLLAKRLPKVGGPYAYSHHVFGDLTGFLVGWGLWVSLWSGISAGSIAFVGYLSTFFPSAAQQPYFGGVIALSLIWLVTLINLSSVKNASITQMLTTALKLLPLLFIAFAGLIFGDVSDVPAANPNKESLPLLIASMVMLTLWAFLGIETVTIPADDIIEPEKTIPKALILAALATMLIYMLATYGVMKLVPLIQLSNSTAPFVDAAEQVLGPIGGLVVACGAVISIFGSLNGVVLSTGQLPAALATNKVFPAIFARKNATGAPATSLIFSSALASILVILNYSKGLMQAFEFIILIATLTALLPFALSALAELVLQRREKSAGQAVKPTTTLITLAALGFSIFTILGAGIDVVLSGLLLLIAGLPIYYWQKIKRKSDIQVD